MKLGRANLDVFASTLFELAQSSPDVIVVVGDSRGSAKLTAFAKALPDRVVELGIAEQNLVGVSAGLASAGKVVFAVSPACFLTARSLEMIKNDVAYSDLPVKLIGISAGVSYGSLGSTHHSLHDLAALQAIHNINIVVPADNFESREAIQAAATHPCPVYIRFGKKPVYDLHGPDTQFEIGKAIPLAVGSDVNFIATGEMVWRAWQACQMLRDRGISAGTVSVHTIKPLDEPAVLDIARRSRAVITVEEHSVYGGLGSRVGALLLQQGVHTEFRILGIPDEYMVTGSQEEVFQHYGLSPEALAEKASALLETRYEIT